MSEYEVVLHCVYHAGNQQSHKEIEIAVIESVKLNGSSSSAGSDKSW